MAAGLAKVRADGDGDGDGSETTMMMIMKSRKPAASGERFLRNTHIVSN